MNNLRLIAVAIAIGFGSTALVAPVAIAAPKAQPKKQAKAKPAAQPQAAQSAPREREMGGGNGSY
ncbi:MAG: hypothetical protein ABWZ80_01115 [Beijerinckiaceae bacterium]